MSFIVAADFATTSHTLPTRFLGTKFFGIGDASQAMVTADGKTLATLLSDSGLQFCAWHELKFTWGTTTSPSSRTSDWIWIVDAMTDAGLGWALMTMAGPLGVGRTSGDPADLPGSYPSNYPAGTTERGPGWANAWATWAVARWTAADCAYYEMDNEWAAHRAFGIPPYWYQDEYDTLGWGATNFRDYKTQVVAVTGLGSLPCFYHSYADGARPQYFAQELDRIIFGTGFAGWPHLADDNDNYGHVSIHAYDPGNVDGSATRTATQVSAHLMTLLGDYTTNIGYLRSKVDAATKMADTEWWVVSRNNTTWDGTSNSREALGHIAGFIVHAARAKSTDWNCHALALWGVGPKTKASGASSDSWIMVDGGQLKRFATYFAIRDMLADFANTYPNVTDWDVSSGLMWIAGKNAAGTAGAVLIANVSGASELLTVSGFDSITSVRKMPTSVTVDSGVTNLGTSVPASIAALEVLYIRGVPSGAVPPATAGPGSHIFAVTINGIGVTEALDLFTITPADDRTCRVVACYLSQSSDVGSAEEEMLRVELIRGHTVAGSGGSTATPVPMNSSDGEASFTARTLDSTIASGGTPVVLHAEAFNVRTGWRYEPDESERPGVKETNTTLVLRLMAAPSDPVTVSATLLVEEF